MELTIKELEVQKLNLNEGDTLAVTIKSDDMTADVMHSLRRNFEEAMPGVRVLIFGVGFNEDVKFSVITEQKQLSYCSDCTCGKKENAQSHLTPEELDKLLGINGDKNE